MFYEAFSYSKVGIRFEKMQRVSDLITPINYRDCVLTKYCVSNEYSQIGNLEDLECQKFNSYLATLFLFLFFWRVFIALVQARHHYNIVHTSAKKQASHTMLHVSLNLCFFILKETKTPLSSRVGIKHGATYINYSPIIVISANVFSRNQQ